MVVIDISANHMPIESLMNKSEVNDSLPNSSQKKDIFSDFDVHNGEVWEES